MIRVLEFMARYDEAGHLHCKQLLPVDLLEEVLKSLLDETSNRNENTLPLIGRHKINIREAYPLIYDLIKSRAIIDICQELLQAGRIRLWQDQVIIKPAHVGKETAWHQDFPFWPMQRP